MYDHDAIIAGASFAGLILADNLDGDILLIDRKEIGSKQTSACHIHFGTGWAGVQEFDFAGI